MAVILLFCVVTILFKASAFNIDDFQSRIIGGNQSSIEETPYLVSLNKDKANNGTFSPECSGSIINETVIITSADCVNGTTPSQWKVRAGSKFPDVGGQLVNVTKIVIHPNFTEEIDYDVALIRLESKLKLNINDTAAISLMDKDTIIADGEEVAVTGFGRTAESSSTYKLKTLITTIMNQQVCKKAYETLRPVTDRMICSGNMTDIGVGVCDRDFGGPMILHEKLAGIISWSFRCGAHGFPPVYTRISSIKSWVDSQLLSFK